MQTHHIIGPALAMCLSGCASIAPTAAPAQHAAQAVATEASAALSDPHLFALDVAWGQDWLLLGELAVRADESPEGLEEAAAHLERMASDARRLAAAKRREGASQ